ncbi:response regulator [Ruminococcus sp. 5_1_39BFAA]|uniref:response regulator transcription factor n=1 Tax=Ruminococcus sp. 5_1_39BFAA TaxID=457412 RepID=UPI0035691E85
MYHVMIIDDEPIIVEGISKLVPWEKYECRVTGTAYSGKEGLEAIRERKPDIIFTDIAMPGLDGLKMIAALKSEFSDMQISILTGYRDFDYCQEAVRLGVTRFLLKPSKIQEIEEALAVMVDNLKKRNIVRRESGEEESTAGSFIVKNALQYMEEHYNEKLTLGMVADKTYVSQWHLSKLLNKQEGKNFSEILNQIRIQRAKELLKDMSLRIADISELVGFTDVAHFSRVFKKNEGISANEYRNTRL